MHAVAPGGGTGPEVAVSDSRGGGRAHMLEHGAHWWCSMVRDDDGFHRRPPSYAMHIMCCCKHSNTRALSRRHSVARTSYRAPLRADADGLAGARAGGRATERIAERQGARVHATRELLVHETNAAT